MDRPRLSFALCVLALPACGSGGAWAWMPPEARSQPLTEVAKGQDGVYLLKEKRISLGFSRRDARGRVDEHAALKILTEKGFSYADLRIAYAKKAEIVSFNARTIAPDGTITDVEATQVFDDEAKSSEKSRGFKVRVFTFPKVEVGSVLEYRYAIEYPFVPGYFDDVIATDLPVEQYRLEVITEESVPIRIKAYNAPPSMKLEELAPNATHLMLTAEQVPAARSESFAEARTMEQPWWALSVMALTYAGGGVFPYNRDWSTAFEGRAKQLYEEADKFHDGYRPAIDVNGCANHRCRIERAMAWLDATLPATDDESWPGKETVQEVLAAKEAGANDRARLLHRALEVLGIEARFAYGRYKLSGLFDADLPNDDSLDHPLLFLPAQEGLEATWIDPECDYCHLGQISERLDGEQALILTPTPDGVGHTVYKGVFAKVGGSRPERNERLVKMELSLEESGGAQLKAQRQYQGRARQAFLQEVRAWTPTDWTKDSEKWSKWMIPGAQLTTHSELLIDAETQRPTRSIELKAPAYAISTGEEIIVPLGLMASAWENSLSEEVRGGAIRVTDSSLREDVLRIPIPPGYQVEQLPAKVQLSSPLFQLDFLASSDGRTVEIRRRLQAKMGVLPVDRYPEVRRVLEGLRATKKEAVRFRKVKVG